MKRIILIFALSFIFQEGFTQISGVLIDNISKAGISNVNVIKKHSGFGVSTDRSGNFSLKSFRIGDTLIFSHISYEKREIVINDTNITVHLKALTEVLSGASVYSKKQAIKITENPWVIDYEILNDSSVLIAKIGSNGSRLELKINNSTSTNPFLDIDRIETDCLNETYVIRRDTAYNVHIKDGELYFKSYLMLEEFELMKKFCHKRIEGFQYFDFFTAMNKVNIFSILQDTTALPFYKIFDKESYQFTASYRNQFNALNSSFVSAGGNRMGDNHPSKGFPHNAAGIRFLERLEDYTEVLERLKTISKLIEYNKQLIILDNVNSELVYFNPNRELSQIKPIQLDFVNTSIKQIIQDPKTEDVYYLVKEKDKTNIYRFNFETFGFEFVTSMKKHIENVKVYNGLIYYLEYNIYNETRELYKMAL